jgi:glycosyltransferase involved in cell wall biosynthesis
VASDCSTDHTEEIVQEFHSDDIHLVRSPERRGKEAAQQCAIEVARGDIIVFTDVGTFLDPQALAAIVRNFADPTIGCVSSEDRIVDADGRVTGERVRLMNASPVTDKGQLPVD